MEYVHFENVEKYFGENHVLKNINLDVEKGEIVTLLGPSGCGKSTLLRCLAGLETVTSGKVYVDGADVTDLTPQKRSVGMVFQQYSLFPNMNVYQNVAFGLQIMKVDKATIDKKAREMLSLVGLPDKLKSYPNQLSGGQQQRVALARALVTEPKVLLLDEPLSAIDALLRRNLQIEIRRIQREANITTIFVTHDQDEAMVMSDKIHLFNVGEIEQSGRPIDLYTHPKTKFAASFIGHYNIKTGEEFGGAVGDKLDCGFVAIRPEIIDIYREKTEMENAYHLSGTVVNSIAHGNIIRYTVDCGVFKLDADVLFGDFSLYEIGEKVYLNIKTENCLQLE